MYSALTSLLNVDDPGGLHESEKRAEIPKVEVVGQYKDSYGVSGI